MLSPLQSVRFCHFAVLTLLFFSSDVPQMEDVFNEAMRSIVGDDYPGRTARQLNSQWKGINHPDRRK